MARPIIISNGRMLVGLNENGLVQDFYFPFVGQSNMTNARQVEHKIGVHVNGAFSWLSDDNWEVSYEFENDALVGSVIYESKNFSLRIETLAFVDIYDDVYCRQFKISTFSESTIDVKVFFHQIFQISANGRADTALYVPSKHPHILTYRGNTALVTSIALDDGTSIDEYAVGVYDQSNYSGTYKDAEDGKLSMNAIEHGGVDSVISTKLSIKPGDARSVDYWVVASSKNYHQATAKHRKIAQTGITDMLVRTRKHWSNWLSIAQPGINALTSNDQKKIKVSLMIIKAHVDERGGVLASSDSSIFNYGKDYYSYIWPRDAAYALTPLLRLGYVSEAMQYFRYVERAMHPKGYMHQKYQPDGGLGSSWHPMLQHGKPELNIQEDETASTVLLFFELAKICNDKDFINDIYKSTITKMLNFMAGYINQSTGLPYPSYDLWEEKFLTTTYSSLLVSKALEIGSIYHDDTDSSNKPFWTTASEVIRANMAKLFSSDKQYFIKGITPEIAGTYEKDTVIDISTLYALFKYGDYSKEHMAVVSTARAVEELIANKSPSGGVARYHDDAYMLTKPFPGNPWHVCTLWLAQYYIWSGKVSEARQLVDWTGTHSLKNGTMSEQIDPETGAEIGVAPLVWSHAELINTLLDMNSVFIK